MTRFFSSLIALPLLAMLAMSTLIAAPQAQAQQGFENLDRIDGLVATTVGARIGQPGGAVAPVDKRLKLKPCPALPHVDPPLSGAATVSCPAIGWRIRVPLLPGGPLAAPAQPAAVARVAGPEAPPVIRKGDPVQLLAGDESFTVSRTMIAEEDGRMGSPIRVRENPRASSITARVEAPGVVRIPGI
jgi:flagella basal body P-ring formation protein FlgA